MGTSARDDADHGPEPRRLLRQLFTTLAGWGVIGAFLAVTVGIAAAAASLFYEIGVNTSAERLAALEREIQEVGSAPTEVRSAPTETVTETETTTEQASTPSMTGDTASPSGSPASVEGRRMDLTLESAVDYSRCARPGNTGSPWAEEAVQIAGSAHPAGISCPISSGTVEGYLDYLVPAGTVRLRGFAGVDDRSRNTTIAAEFAVLTPDGTVLFQQTSGYDTAVTLDVALEDLRRIRLRMRLTGFTEDPFEQNGRVSWGDLHFES